MDCLDRDTLQLLLEGELPDEERAEAQAHLAGCAPCRAHHAEVQAALPPDPLDQEDTPTTARPAAATPPPGPMSLARGASVGRYLVLDKLGQGGMGEVYAAFDPQLNRRVALKLLLPHDSAEDVHAKERLLREAQAMAQLSHPNVLPVFDVGEHAGRVFIAMEYVEGQTLRAWQKAERHRPWPEVVRLFLEAGRGLAAAHKAGLVHRDFKPDNVLLSRDGRVYVMDFGLARAGGEASRSATPSGGGSGGLPSGDGTGTQLTQVTGLLATHLTQNKQGVIGTPGFMPPEQIRSEELDGRADVFAFAASLYLGLYAHKPFAGASAREALAATLAGQVRPPPREARVPAWLHRVVLKGLAGDRDQRFASMDALLAALKDDPTVRVRRWALGAVALVALVAAVAVPRSLAARRAAACEADAQAFAQLWSPERRAGVERAFRATGVPYVDAALTSVRAGLDAYGARWARQHAEACLATRVERTAPESELALRTGCLERRRADVAALLDVFDGADARTVERSSAAVSRLAPLDACADLGALLRQVKPPEPAQQARVAEARADLTRARALYTAGRIEAALKTTEPWLARARALGYRPLEAEVLANLGQFQQEFGQRPEARRTLRAALAAAEACNHDEVKKDAVANLTWILSDDPTLADEARQWSEWGFALLARLPHSEHALARLHYHHGWVMIRENKPADAEVELHKAVDYATTAAGAGSADAMMVSNALGVALTNQGKLAEALALYERLLRDMEPALGGDHPRIGILRANLSRVYTAQGQYAQAVEVGQRALDTFRAVWSLSHPNYGRMEGTVAEPLLGLERYADALRFAEASVQHIEASLGATTPELAEPLMVRAQALLALGRAAEALPHAERARELARGLPDNNEGVDLVGGVVAQVLLAQGRPLQALPLLQAARTRLQASKSGVQPRDLAWLRFLVARAGWEAGRGAAPRADALREALAARAELQQAAGAERYRRQADAWLAPRAPAAAPLAREGGRP